jgi:hypothetical protein
MLRLIRQRGDRDGRLTSKRLRTVRARSHSTVRRCRCEESGRRRSKDAPRHRAYWYMRDGEQPEILRRYFVAHVAQISRGNAQANAVNSTDLAWSRLVRDQEDGGSNPLAPTTFFRISDLQHTKIRRAPGPGPGSRWFKPTRLGHLSLLNQTLTATSKLARI